MKFKQNMKRVIWSVILAMALLLPGTNIALADDYYCTGTLGAITVDNLRVPQNETCTLLGTWVEGNIFVEYNATLLADDVHVHGNIQAEYAAKVNVYPGSFVGGSIQIVHSGESAIHGVDIYSDLYFDYNNGFLNIAENTIGGNLQAFQNTGGVSIISNSIGGNLQCKYNFPPPTGGGNYVAGDMEDQCGYFGGDPLPIPPPVPLHLIPPGGFIMITFLPMMRR